MRDYKQEIAARVTFIRNMLISSSATGIIYGNSGGKDSALVSILCKMACENTVGIIMPCGCERNYGIDKDDALTIAAQYHIKTRVIDLSHVRNACIDALEKSAEITQLAIANIAPRLRMTCLYTLAASENRLVAGTGNRSECHMGYFTKWGDSAYDFNPIADLTVTEVFEFLRYLNAPDFILHKVPSAGLYDGQTDENEMGISYQTIDQFLLTGAVDTKSETIINTHHKASEHKRNAPAVFQTRYNNYSKD